LAGLACLFPVAIYCLYLALLHNRRTPTLIPGSWDFAGTLIALSGFLLIGGTVFVFSLHTAVRDAWLKGGGLADLRRAYSQVDVLTLTVWGAYALALIGGSAWLVWSRREYTSVYNVTPAEMEDVVEKMCGRLGLSFGRRGTRLLVGYERAGPDALTDVLESTGFAARRSATTGKAALDLDGSEPMRFVSLRWAFTTPDARHDLEAELARQLAQFESSAGPVAGWFTTAAGALMILMIFGLGTFLLLALR
jgi:hypothetical protein